MHDRTKRRVLILIEYLSGQGFVQIGNLSVGLLLLRWLSIEDYAKYSVTFGFQATFSILTDLGISGTILALVGQRFTDRELVGKYIGAAQRFRFYMLLFLGPIGGGAYLFIAGRHGWATGESLINYSSVIVSIYFGGIISCYSSPLLLNSQVSTFLRGQSYAVIFRFISCLIAYLIGALNGIVTNWIGTGALVITSLVYLKAARPLVTSPAFNDKTALREMARYVLPNTPSVVFFALQGQVSLFLIAILGNTANIAQVGALGRLSQVFAFFSGANTALIGPYVAKLKVQAVRKKVDMIAGVAILISGIAVAAAFLWPQIFLLLLGNKYSGLQLESAWFVFGSSLYYIVGVLNSIAVARRWVYWRTSWLTLGLVITAQVLVMMLLKMDTTFNVVYLMVVTASANLLCALINVRFGQSQDEPEPDMLI